MSPSQRETVERAIIASVRQTGQLQPGTPDEVILDLAYGVCGQFDSGATREEVMEPVHDLLGLELATTFLASVGGLCPEHLASLTGSVDPELPPPPPSHDRGDLTPSQRDSAERAFIEAVRETGRFQPEAPDDMILDLAYGICDALDAGSPVEDVIGPLAAAFGAEFNAIAVVAIGSFCPEYLDF